MKSKLTHTVQEWADPNSGNNIFWECESCNPKTWQGVKQLLVGRAHRWKDRGRKVKKRIVGCMCGKSPPSRSPDKKKKKKRIDVGPDPHLGSERASSMLCRWFHKHFAEDEQNEIYLWVIIYECYQKESAAEYQHFAYQGSYRGRICFWTFIYKTGLNWFILDWGGNHFPNIYRSCLSDLLVHVWDIVLRFCRPASMDAVSAESRCLTSLRSNCKARPY